MGYAITRRCRCNGKHLLLFVAVIGCTALWFTGRYGNYEPLLRFHQLSDNTSDNKLQNAPDMAHILEREVRIFCWVLTTPKNHKTKAMTVLRTWGKRCTKLLFVTSHKENEFESLQLPVVEDYKNLWGKTRGAFEHIYEDHRHEADWFLKADDDTFVFVENLRYLLSPYSADMPIYFGNKMLLDNQTYMSGGGGYVLSREALRRLVTIGFANDNRCYPKDAEVPEDFAMGMCLEASNVLAGDSRDATLKQRMVLLEPYPFIIADYFKNFWYLNTSYYYPQSCMDCLSQYAATFHYVPPERMNFYEFFKYEFKAFGLQQDDDEEDIVRSLPQKLLPEEVVIPPGDNSRRIV